MYEINLRSLVYVPDAAVVTRSLFNDHPEYLRKDFVSFERVIIYKKIIIYLVEINCLKSPSKYCTKRRGIILRCRIKYTLFFYVFTLYLD